MITSNRRLPVIAAGALLVALAQPALAQKPITNPPVASILTWTQKQQLERYPAIETVYAVDTIKKGDKVRALPAAATQIDPEIAFNKRASIPMLRVPTLAACARSDMLHVYFDELRQLVPGGQGTWTDGTGSPEATAATAALFRQFLNSHPT